MMPPLKTAFQSSCPREAGLIPAFLIRSRREVTSVSTPCRLRTARPYPQESSRSPLAVCITVGSAIPMRFFRLAASMPLSSLVPISRQNPSFRRRFRKAVTILSHKDRSVPSSAIRARYSSVATRMSVLSAAAIRRISSRTFSPHPLKMSSRKASICL